MSRRFAFLTTLLVLAGCQATGTGSIVVSQASPGAKASPKSSPKVSPKAELGRTVSLQVVGPNQLAAAGGGILNDAGAGLVQGGKILNDAGAGLVAAGGGNLVAAGGGNLVAAGGGNYSLLDATASFVPVETAAVQVLGLDGQAIGAVVTTNAKGEVSLKGLPTDQATTIFAAFRVNKKVYRVAAVLGADAAPEMLMLDPINTMVEARVREQLKGKTAAAALTNERLKNVWSICNKADITLAPEELEAGKPLADLTAALSKAWTAAIDAKVTTASEKAEIKAFMTELAAVK